jgi:hypothetical protein
MSRDDRARLNSMKLTTGRFSVARETRFSLIFRGTWACPRTRPSRGRGGPAHCYSAKKARVRTSMLSRAGASAGAVGSSNAVWAVKRARRRSAS